MEVDSRSRRRLSFFRFAVSLCFLVVSWRPSIILAATEELDVDVTAVAGRCNVDLSSFLPLPYGGVKDMECKPVWNTFVLQYSQSKDHVLTVVLSAVYTMGWVGMGFSSNGKMLNSSAMVGWINKEGIAHIKQYHLKGFRQREVIPDKGNLPLSDNVPTVVALRGATLYMGFQLKFNSTLSRQYILLAFGSRYPTAKHKHLYHHDDKTAIIFDFASGSVSVARDSAGETRKTHGSLGIIGWGLILPWGAIAARYFRHHDPLWYYLHIGIQFTGFIIGLAAAVVGLSLYNRMHASFPAHRGIGIFVLVLSILQILAFFLRPEKESKKRKYWNWYHHWFGRIAILLANINIILGINIANAGNGWKGGYGFLLSTLLIATIVLEVFLRIKRRDQNQKNNSDFQINSSKPIPPDHFTF
ncbi:cytochrome b561 and DOMON domain-containing protein At3g61750-like [Impatiens glandulifera]|uniref:cytochrome b561 and DOMON domain-containing protein At3g61750-like n=1 Tax=Impatiens glandulifera TaxID=253017 RepID=UPI001FB197A0|nr:cytochrome b561 and DOMON domain-containing protein At3g61750-like [Impatiens glandulifera]